MFSIVTMYAAGGTNCQRADAKGTREYLRRCNRGYSHDIGGSNARQSNHYRIANFPDPSSGTTFKFPTCTVCVQAVTA